MSTAIRDVGEALVQLLRDELVPDSVSNDSQIVLISPGEIQPKNTILSLTLDSIVPVTEMRNETAAPSLALDLHYLLTAYAQPGKDRTEKTLEAHAALGAAMRVFLDHAVLNNGEIRIILQGMTAEDLARMPGTSVSYKVTPVRLNHA
jgi:hypothetical protein